MILVHECGGELTKSVRLTILYTERHQPLGPKKKCHKCKATNMTYIRRQTRADPIPGSQASPPTFYICPDNMSHTSQSPWSHTHRPKAERPITAPQNARNLKPLPSRPSLRETNAHFQNGQLARKKNPRETATHQPTPGNKPTRVPIRTTRDMHPPTHLPTRPAVSSKPSQRPNNSTPRMQPHDTRIRVQRLNTQDHIPGPLNAHVSRRQTQFSSRTV